MIPPILPRLLKRQGWLIPALALLLHCGDVAAHPSANDQLHRLDDLIATSPNDYRLYLDRSALLIDEHLFSQAEEDLAKAEQLQRHINTGYLRGLIAEGRGDIGEAIRHYTRFLDRYPADPLALARRGEAYRLLQEINLAYADFRAALNRQQPQNPGTALAAAELAVQLNQPDEAIHIVDTVNAKIGITPQLQLFAVDTLVNSNHLEKAVSYLDKLLAVTDNNPEWLLRKGELLLALGDSRGAKRAADAVQTQLAQRKPTPWQLGLLGRVTQLQQSAAQSPLH